MVTGNCVTGMLACSGISRVPPTDGKMRVQAWKPKPKPKIAVRDGAKWLRLSLPPNVKPDKRSLSMTGGGGDLQ